MAHKGPRAPGPPPAVCPQAIPGGLPGGSCPPHASWCQSAVLPRGPVPSLFSWPPSPGSVRTPLAVKGPASGLTHPTLFRDEGRTGQGLSHGASSHGPGAGLRDQGPFVYFRRHAPSQLCGGRHTSLRPKPFFRFCDFTWKKSANVYRVTRSVFPTRLGRNLVNSKNGRTELTVNVKVEAHRPRRAFKGRLELGTEQRGRQ